LNARSLGRTSIGFFLIVAALFSLTGCQLLGNQKSQINDSVVLGSTTLDFGKVGMGNSKSMQNQLTNFKTSSVTIVSISGLDPTVQVSGITLPLVLSPGEVAQFSVVFLPSAAGKINKTLSEGRAEAVAKYLETSGIDQSKIEVNGMGDQKPISSNKTKEGRAQNRRVDITITPTQAM